MKFQAIAEKTAKNSGEGYFYLLQPLGTTRLVRCRYY